MKIELRGQNDSIHFTADKMEQDSFAVVVSGPNLAPGTILYQSIGVSKDNRHYSSGLFVVGKHMWVDRGSRYIVRELFDDEELVVTK